MARRGKSTRCIEVLLLAALTGLASPLWALDGVADPSMDDIHQNLNAQGDRRLEQSTGALIGAVSSIEDCGPQIPGVPQMPCDPIPIAVAGATVELSPVTADPSGPASPVRAATYRTVTSDRAVNSGPNFEIPVVPWGTYRYTVTHPEYDPASGTVTISDTSTHLDIRLNRRSQPSSRQTAGGSIIFRVMTILPCPQAPSGEPQMACDPVPIHVAHAEIVLHSPPSAHADGYTNRYGSVEFLGAGGRMYFYTVTHPGYVPESGIVMMRNPTTHLEVMLKRSSEP